ncbi:immunoglobulin I-set domain protein, partial [Ostertagia ostertagi]
LVERANPRDPALAEGSVAPHFDSILCDRDAVEGEKVVMMVSIQSAPLPDVRFYCDGKLICDDVKHEIRHELESNTHWLILKNAEKTEQAEYACQAVNAAGEAWCYSYLTVRALDKGLTDVMAEAQAKLEAELEEKSPVAATLASEMQLSRGETENGYDGRGTSALLQKTELEGIEAKSTSATRKQKKQKKGDPAMEGRHAKEPGGFLGASERFDLELYEEIRSQGEIDRADAKEVLAETLWEAPDRTSVMQPHTKQKEKKHSATNEFEKAHPGAETEEVKKAELSDTKSCAGFSGDSAPVATAMENKVDHMRGGKGGVVGNASNQKDERENNVEKLGKWETSKYVVSPTRRESSPDAAGRKKKSIPKALLIPAQISSRFGDPSVLHSEAIMTTSIRARENSAEASSPIKQPRSAIISMKVSSAGRTRSASGTSDGEFSFNVQSSIQEKPETEAYATLNLHRDKTSLPPEHAKKVVKKQAGGEPNVAPAPSHEISIAPEEPERVKEKGTLDFQPGKVSMAAHENDRPEIELTFCDGLKATAASRVGYQSLSVESLKNDTTEERKRLRGSSKVDREKGEEYIMKGKQEKMKIANDQGGTVAGDFPEESVNKAELEVVDISLRKPEIAIETKNESLSRSQKDANGLARTANENQMVVSEAKLETELSKTSEKSFVEGTANDITSAENTKTLQLRKKVKRKAEVGRQGQKETASDLENDGNFVTGAEIKEESCQPTQSIGGDRDGLCSAIETTERKETCVKRVKGEKKAMEHGISEGEEISKNEAAGREDVGECREKSEILEEIRGEARLVAPDRKKVTMRKLRDKDKKKMATKASLAEPIGKEGKAVEFYCDPERMGTIGRADQAEANEVGSIREETERHPDEGFEREEPTEHRRDEKTAEFVGRSEKREDRTGKKRNLDKLQECAAAENGKMILEEPCVLSHKHNDQLESNDGSADVNSSLKKGTIVRKVSEGKKGAAHFENDQESDFSKTAVNSEDKKTSEIKSSEVLSSFIGEHEDSQRKESGDNLGNQKEGKRQKIVKRLEKKTRKEASNEERAPDDMDLEVAINSYPMNQEVKISRPLEEADQTTDVLSTKRSTKEGVIDEEDAAHTSTTRKRVEPNADEANLIPAFDTVAVLDANMKGIIAKITKPLECRTVGKEGEPITFKIELERPAHDIKWTKNGEAIAVSEKYDIVSDGTSCSLTIKNADCDDAGQYVVAADKSESFTDLHILGKPRIKPSKNNLLEVEKDESIMLTVGFDCQDDVAVSWFFNGVPVSEDMNAQVGVQGNLLKFCKRQATKADSGEYTVKLSNEFGESTEVFIVNVKDAPGPPVGISVNEINRDSISIAWQKPLDDGGVPITGYVIKKKEAGRRTFQKIAEISDEKVSHIVEDLEVATDYVLSVAAVNKYGVGEAMEIPVVTAGEPFRAPQITEHPFISDISNDGCVLKWSRPEDDGGTPIHGYHVYLRESSGEWQKVNSELVFATRFSVGDLLQGVAYEFKVEAVNEAGLVSNSNVASQPLFITPVCEIPTTVLSVPRITITSADSVTVEWDVPKNVTPAEFTVAYKSESSSVWNEVNCSASFCRIAGLKEDVSYVFKVAMRNESGVGTFSQQSEPIKIRASKAPTVIKAIRDVLVANKETLRLECHSSGYPTPEFIWYKDGVEITPQNDNVEIISEGHVGLLIIHSVGNSDSGSYSCEVVNPHGWTKCTASVSVTDVRCHFESAFPENVEIMEAQDLTLSCTLSDKDGAVTWFKDGKVLDGNDRVLISSDGAKRTLKILSAKDTDKGTYRCESSDGRSRTEGEVVVKGQAPQITSGPQDLIVDKIGMDAKFCCKLSRPAHQVLWYKNGKEIWAQANKYIITTSGNASTLEIQNIDKSDIGDYSAALNEKEHSASAHLKLEVPPQISIWENLDGDVVFKVHDELAFHVEVDGHPHPTVSIFHKDLRIQNRASVDEYDNVVSVRMKNLSRDDCGTVTITAENEVGAVHREFILVVLDVPSEPLDLSSAETTVNSTMLSWNNPEKANGAPITGFIIERKAVDSNRWRLIGRTSADTTQFEATNLVSSQVYEFRVIAVNSAGEGSPSCSIDVLTKDDEESKLGSSENSLLFLLETPEIPEASLDGTKVTLSWNAVPNANVYQLARQRDEGDWLEIGEMEETNFVDSSLRENGSYRYRVVAKSSSAESKPSDSSTTLLIRALAEQINDEGTVAKVGKAKGRADRSEAELLEKRDESPKPSVKKPLNPVDDIVNTKQRLKKRKPVENERLSVQQDVDDAHSPPTALQPSQAKETFKIEYAEMANQQGNIVGRLEGSHIDNSDENLSISQEVVSKTDVGAVASSGATAAVPADIQR